MAAANHLHLALFKATLRTRLAFFDTTPLGRVIQRFTKDTATLDNTLGNSVSSFASFFLLLLGTLCVMSWVMPALLPCLVPIGALYYYVQHFFRPGYREAKRLDGISGSPIYAHFGETLTGISTIRAFGHQRRFIAENERRISLNQRADYTQKCGCDRWLPVRLETIGNSITFVVACLGTWQRGSTYAALVGLTLSYAIDMTGLLSWLIRIVSELESNMVSVERVSEYAELESEEAQGAALRGGVQPPPNPRVAERGRHLVRQTRDAVQTGASPSSCAASRSTCEPGRRPGSWANREREVDPDRRAVAARGAVRGENLARRRGRRLARPARVALEDHVYPSGPDLVQRERAR